MSNIGNTIVLNPKEHKRTYYFPSDEKVELNNVIELTIRESGTHRLRTEDNKLHIVPTGWLHIVIESKDWAI